MLTVSRNFKRLATIKGVDVEALRGDYFEPREFWGQKPESIFDALYTTLLKHNVPYVLCRPVNIDCIVSNWEKEFPKIELSLEKSVFEQTNLFMSKRGLDGLNSDKFHASLMLKRELFDTQRTQNSSNAAFDILRGILRLQTRWISRQQICRTGDKKNSKEGTKHLVYQD